MLMKKNTSSYEKSQKTELQDLPNATPRLAILRSPIMRSIVSASVSATSISVPRKAIWYTTTTMELYNWRLLSRVKFKPNKSSFFRF